MAACGSLHHIFETPLPETPSSIFDTLSSPWNKITTTSIDESAFTELFGELHFKENNHHHHVDHQSSSSSSISSSSSSSFPLSSLFSSLSSSSLLFPDASQKPGTESFRLGNDKNDSTDERKYYYPTSQKKQYRHSNSFSSMNSENLSLCTEGLGFESSDDIEDLRNDICIDQWLQQSEKTRNITKKYKQYDNCYSESRRSSRIVRTRGSFPPPISCIGRNGKPWVCFKSFRQDGRFILKEIRIPTQEFLHACREDGRLKLQLIQSDDEYVDDDDDLEDFDEEDEGKGEDGDGDGDGGEEEEKRG